MDYTTAFAISASGMNVERQRLEVVALNLANVNTLVRGEEDGFQPLRLVSRPRPSGSFQVHFGDAMKRISLPGGVEVDDVEALEIPPRRVYEPSHPAADDDGFVSYPDINPVSEMIQLIEATRAYEANVRAINAAKTMAMSAIEIGRRR